MAGTASQLGDLPSFDDYIDGLFGGVDGTEGDAAKKCDDKKGHIAGVGPNCVNYEEEGKRDIMVCWYEKTMEYIATLREISFPACAKIVQLSVIRTNENAAAVDPKINALSLVIKNANNDYAKKIKKLPDTCECKICVFNIDNRTKEPATTDAAGDSTTPAKVNKDTTKNDTTQQVSTDSAYTIIPRVYGHYITTGNIIWIGNQQTTPITYPVTDTDGTTTETDDIVSTIDMIVGLAVGPLNRVMRIWFSDILVYNATIDADSDGIVTLSPDNNGSTDLDISALLDDDYNTARLAAFKPTVEFFDGGQTQHVIPVYAEENGFGRVPAHRGLSLLHFSDIDLKLFGGSFPEIRIEVISNEPLDILPRIAAANLGTFIGVDQRTSLSVSFDGTDIILQDYLDLSVTYTATPETSTAILPLVSGNILTQGDNTYAFDPFRSLSFGPFTTKDIGPASVAFLGYDDTAFMYDFGIVADDTGFDIVRFDYSKDLPSVIGSVATEDGYVPQAGFMSSEGGVLFYYQFLLPDPTQDSLRIIKYAMTDDSSIVTSTPDSTTFTITADVWGGITSGLTVQAVLDNVSGDLLVFLSGADTMLRIDRNGEIVWGITIEDIPNQIKGLVAASPFYYVISAPGQVVRINLADGVADIVGEITDFSTGVAGLQYFDGNTGSIIFTDDTNIVRIFPDKLVAAPTFVGVILDDLMHASGLSPDLLDTSDVQDVILNGYYIDAPVSVPSLTAALGELYQFDVVDTGSKLTVVKSITLNTPVTVPADDIIVTTFKTSRLLAADKIEVATAKFYTIDDTGLVENDQAVSLKPDDEALYTSIDFSLQLTDDPTRVRQHLEQVVVNRIAQGQTLDVQFCPRQLAIVPNDRVTINDITYRVVNKTDSFDLSGQIQGYFYDKEAIEISADLTSVALNGGLRVTRPEGQSPYRPVILFTSALTDEDAANSFDQQIVYVGLDTPVRTGIVPKQFVFRLDSPPNPGSDFVIASAPIYDPVMDRPTSPSYTTQFITEGVHSGKVVDIPVSIFPRVAEKNSSTLVVKFQHTDTPSKFVSVSNPLDICATPTKNLLLVGRELIQFSTWSVDIDEKTVTFRDLHRGRFGTEAYMFGHAVGEDVYLYTPETLTAIGIDPSYTYAQVRARAVIQEVATAGTPILPYTYKSDAGSARPYPPDPVKRYQGFGGDPTVVDLSWHLRRSFSIPLVDNLGGLPYPWYDGSPGSNSVVIAHLQRLPVSMNEWDAEFTAHVYSDFVFDPTFIYQVQFLDNQPVVGWGSVDTDTLFGEEGDPFIIAVMEVRTYAAPDGNAYDIIGHPNFHVFPQGHYPDSPLT